MKSCKMCLHSEVCRDNDLVPAHKCEFFISKSQFQQSIAEGDTFYYLVDGHIKGEVELGKLKDDADITQREHRINKWLMEQGW